MPKLTRCIMHVQQCNARSEEKVRLKQTLFERRLCSGAPCAMYAPYPHTPGVWMQITL